MNNPVSLTWMHFDFANSVDPDETAHYESSQLELHCLTFCSCFITDIPNCNNR